MLKQENMFYAHSIDGAAFWGMVQLSSTVVAGCVYILKVEEDRYFPVIMWDYAPYPFGSNEDALKEWYPDFEAVAYVRVYSQSGGGDTRTIGGYIADISGDNRRDFDITIKADLTRN